MQKEEQWADQEPDPRPPEGGRQGSRGNEDRAQSTQTLRVSSYTGEEQTTCYTQSGQLVAKGTKDPGGGKPRQRLQMAESNTEPGEDELKVSDQPDPEEQPGMLPEYEDRGGEEDQKEAIRGDHMLHTTKYGSEVLQTMRTKVSNVNKEKGIAIKVEALANSGASASMLSFDLAIKLKIKIKGIATLRDAYSKLKDVSGRGEVTLQEE